MKHSEHLIYWLVVVILSVLLVQFSVGKTIATDASPPEIYSKDGELSDVKLSFFSPQGRQLYYLESGTLSYFTEQKHTRVRPLQIVYTTPEGVTVTLNSDAGQTLEEGLVIELQGNVFVRKSESPDAPMQTAQTSYLTIDTRNQIATTDKPATLKLGDQTLNGTGMEIDLNSGKMRLLEDVRMSKDNVL